MCVQAVRGWQDYVNMRKTHTANPNAPPGGRKHHDHCCIARPSPIHLSRLPPRAQANASLRAGSWLGAAEETFASTEQQPLERIEEYEGRMALLEQRSAKL